MTTEEAKMRAELYSALADGKTIQVLNSKNSIWTDMEIDCVECFPEGLNYRIKSDTKYRPFKNQEECLNELQRHIPYGFLENKESGRTIQICGFYNGIQDKRFKIVYSGISSNCCETANSVYYHYKFKDGTPFGIREE